MLSHCIPNCYFSVSKWNRETKRLGHLPLQGPDKREVLLPRRALPPPIHLSGNEVASQTRTLNKNLTWISRKCKPRTLNENLTCNSRKCKPITCSLISCKFFACFFVIWFRSNNQMVLITTTCTMLAFSLLPRQEH